MSKEELLQPRYEVVAPWPNGLNKAGQILVCAVRDYYECVEDTTLPLVHRPQDFPLNLRRLHWSERRKAEDMPEYVMANYADKLEGKGVLQNGMIFKVEQWATEIFPTIKYPQLLANLEGYTPDYLWRTPDQKTGRVNACHLLPSSEQEYIDYIKSK